MIDLNSMTSEQLEELAKQRKEQEQAAEQKKREAYEGLRNNLLTEVQVFIVKYEGQTKELVKYLDENCTSFRCIMEEYGKLIRTGQSNFTIRNEHFKWEVKSNKVKSFDERADIAAERLIEFLRAWIKNQQDRTENPMYQLAMTLLERNKYGDLDYKSVSKLYDLEAKFNNTDYSEIMQLFKESNVVHKTARNHYFFQKDDLGVWRRLEISFNRL